jgi:hypothetical protein
VALLPPRAPETRRQCDLAVGSRCSTPSMALHDTASWSFVIHELAPLPAAPHIAFSDDEVAAADVDFEPLPCWIVDVVGHDEDSIKILDCFVRRHTKSRNRMTALMMIRRKRPSSLCWLLFCSSALINHHCDEKDHR